MKKYLGKEIIRKAGGIPGAISYAEMVALYQTISKYLKVTVDREEIAVDLGSNCGKSSYILANSFLDLGRTDYIDLIDPIYEETNHPLFREVIRDAFKDHRELQDYINNNFSEIPYQNYKLFPITSIEYLVITKILNYRFSYVFIDSADHEEDLVMQEVKMIENLVAPGGLVFFHDFGNYTGPVKGYEYLLSTGKYEKIEIDWISAIEFLIDNNLDENDNNSWHKFEGKPNPNYLGCLRRREND